MHLNAVTCTLSINIIMNTYAKTFSSKLIVIYQTIYENVRQEKNIMLQDAGGRRFLDK